MQAHTDGKFARKTGCGVSRDYRKVKILSILNLIFSSSMIMKAAQVSVNFLLVLIYRRVTE